MITIDEFAAESDRFCAAHWPRRNTSLGAWGEGADEISVYAPKSEEDYERELAAARRWRRLKFDAGFGWISGPVDYGGRALPVPYERAFLDAESRYDVPNQIMFGGGLGIIGPTILAHGPGWMKEHYLRSIYRGEVLACQFFSEPDAGSDLASLRTRAERDGEEWVINGQKVWSSNAHRADVGLLLARSSPEKAKHAGITAFLLPTGLAGVLIQPLRQMTGGAEFNEVFFTDVRLPDRYRIGEIDGGWSIVRTTLGNERASIGSGSGYGGAGLAGLVPPERVRQMLVHFGLAADPFARQDFARLYTGYEIARYTSLRSAAAVEAGRPLGPWTATSKLFLTDHLNRSASFVARVLGPRIAADSGEWGTYAWLQLLLGVVGARIGGGTDEILRNTIAERVLDLPRS